MSIQKLKSLFTDDLDFCSFLTHLWEKLQFLILEQILELDPVRKISLNDLFMNLFQFMSLMSDTWTNHISDCIFFIILYLLYMFMSDSLTNHFLTQFLSMNCLIQFIKPVWMMCSWIKLIHVMSLMSDTWTNFIFDLYIFNNFIIAF